MYYVDCLVMVASFLKPSLNSKNGIVRLKQCTKLSEEKNNQNLIKPLFALICLFICFVFVPERPSNLASICQKYHSASACEIW